MIEQKKKQKIDASQFFDKRNIAIKPRSEFKAELREKILEKYSNIYYGNEMNADTLVKVPFWKNPKYKLLRVYGFVALLVVLLIPIVIFAYSGNSKNEDKSEDIQESEAKLFGELAYFEGTVEINTSGEIDTLPGTSTWETAEEGMRVEEGNSLRTIGESRAIINLDDGSSVRLDNNSSLTLKQMNPDHIIISNDSGQIYSRVVKAERKFEVEVEEVTFKSLGTAFKTLNSTESQGVVCYESTVGVQEPGQEKDVTVTQGNKYFVKNSAKPEEESKVTEVTVEEIKTDSFALWNKDQDSKDSEFKTKLGVLSDLTSPDLTIENPADGTSTEDSKVTIVGTTEADGRLFINDGEITISSDGKFSKEVELKEGENEFKVKAKDKAGNVTEKTIKVTRTVPAPVVTQTVTPTPAPQQQSSGISLSGAATGEGIQLNWTVTNLDVSGGFKIVKSSNPNPSYPNDNPMYVGGDARSQFLNITGGGTYHFRICRYTGSGCDSYSNNITVTAPNVQTTLPNVITISPVGSAVSISFDVASTYGYKVTWSKNSGPTYPARSGDSVRYLDNANSSNSGNLDAFDGSGTYYVRVCAYNNGICGTYSNEATVNL